MDGLKETHHDLDGSLEKVKQKLEEIQEEHNQKLEQATIIKKSLNEKVLELEVEVERLRVKVSEAKVLSITEYKGLGTYKFDLEATVSLLLAKEIIKLWRLLRKLHQSRIYPF